MKKTLFIIMAFFASACLWAQGIKQGPHADIHEFDLENGLHVIISLDSTSPVVCVGMMYHVGSHNESPELTGFAHFFEHLLFHGTKNIPEAEFENLMRSAGGYSNASTTADRTFYYTIFPSNQYRLGLWIEAERMLHPIITQKGIDREREVVKEESRQRYDASNTGRMPADMLAFEYEKYPYRWPTIGSMEHLNAATINDFNAFREKFYAPNNACLILTGNVNIEDAKEYINAYFNRIPRGTDITRPVYDEKPSGREEIMEKSAKIEKPHMIISYRTVPQKTREARVLEFIITYLNFNNQGPLDKLVDANKTMITKIGSSTELYEDAGSVWIRASFNDSVPYRKVLDKIDSEMLKLAQQGINVNSIAQLKTSFESSYTDMYYDMHYLNEVLGLKYFIWGDARKVNSIIDDYQSISNEEIKAVAQKYLVPGNRKVIVYHPQK